MTSGPADTHIFHLNAIKKYKKCSKPTGSKHVQVLVHSMYYDNLTSSMVDIFRTA